MIALSPTPVIETARLILRTPQGHDRKPWAAFASSGRARYIGGPHDRPNASAPPATMPPPALRAGPASSTATRSRRSAHDRPGFFVAQILKLPPPPQPAGRWPVATDTLREADASPTVSGGPND